MPIKHPIKKGNKFELAVIQKICNIFGLEYGKDLRRRYRGEKGNDIVFLSKKAMDTFPFSIESKDRQRWEIPKWWKKVVEDSEEGFKPAIVMHNVRTNKQFIFMDFDDFLDIVRKANGQE